MRKNIAILVNSISKGGAEKVATNLSIHLSKNNNVYLFVETRCEKEYTYAGQIVDVSSEKKSLETCIKEAKEKYHIDIAISFMEEMNFVNILTKNKETVIVSVHCSIDDTRLFHDSTKKKMSEYYKYADGIIAVSEGLKYSLINDLELDSKRVWCIYNPVEEKIKEKSIEKELIGLKQFLDGSKMILSIGRLTYPKTPQKTIIQYKKLLEKGIDAKLVFLGTGDYKSEIEEMVKNNDLDSKVKVIDFDINPYPYYRLADILVVSSNYEGFPNVIVEAFALELPVVATDSLTGPREMIVEESDYSKELPSVLIGKNGVLVRNTQDDLSGETDFLMQGMQLLLDNTEICEQVKLGEQDFSNRYSNEEIMKQWDIVINSAEKNIIKTTIRCDYSDLISKKIYLYGAGKIGKKTAKRLKEEGIVNLAFVVSEKEVGVDSINGIPVKSINEITVDADTLIYVTVGERLKEEITEILKNRHIDYSFL